MDPVILSLLLRVFRKKNIYFEEAQEKQGFRDNLNI